jgi:6-phosphogluconolactonase
MSSHPSRTTRLGRIVLLLLLYGWALGGRPGAPLVASGPALAAIEAAPQKLWVYVGTYTGKSKGIYLCELDLGSGELTLQGLAAMTVNPSFLAIDPAHRFLYAVNEVDHVAGSKSATVSAFAINPQSGALTFLNQQSSRGTTPAHLTVDREGKNVLVANYGSGSVAVLPIGPDGRLAPATGFAQHHGSSVNKSRQEGPHAHCVAVDPANRFAFVADLGLDQVLIYQFDATQGLLAPNAPPFAAVAPGSGPRHFTFHPSGRTAYVINELFSTITTFGYDPGTGALQTLQTVSTLPPAFKKTNTTAEVQVHPSGKFLYGSNRGHDSIAIFAIDPATGLLTPTGYEPTGGKTPRNFSIDPTGVYLLAANQDSGTVVVFKIDLEAGGLTPTGHPVAISMPVCVAMIPAPG